MNSDNDVFLDIPSPVASSGHVIGSDDSSSANSSSEHSTTELSHFNHPRHPYACYQDDSWTT